MSMCCKTSSFLNTCYTDYNCSKLTNAETLTCHYHYHDSTSYKVFQWYLKICLKILQALSEFLNLCQKIFLALQSIRFWLVFSPESFLLLETYCLNSTCRQSNNLFCLQISKKFVLSKKSN